MRCEYLLEEDKCEFTLNFSSSSANDPRDDPVSELEVSDWDVRRARVGEGDDNFRSSLLAFLLVSLLVEPVLGNDFLRFFECRLIISFKPLLDECLLLDEVQLNGEHVIFKSVGSSKADVCRGLLDADKWRDGGTVSHDEVRSTPSLEVAIMKYNYAADQPHIIAVSIIALIRKNCFAFICFNINVIYDITVKYNTVTLFNQLRSFEGKTVKKGRITKSLTWLKLHVSYIFTCLLTDHQ